jgi:hypothetical protein
MEVGPGLTAFALADLIKSAFVFAFKPYNDAGDQDHSCKQGQS